MDCGGGEEAIDVQSRNQPERKHAKVTKRVGVVGHTAER